jgi:hypothetical protein
LVLFFVLKKKTQSKGNGVIITLKSNITIYINIKLKF